MKKITIRVEPAKKNADYAEFRDYIIDCYPTDQCDLDPKSSDLKMTFVFYAGDEKQVLPWFEPSAPEFGFKVREKTVEVLSARQSEAVRKRLDG